MKKIFFILVLVINFNFFFEQVIYAQTPEQFVSEAMMLHQSGKTFEAIAMLNQAISYDSTFKQAYLALGQIYLEIEEYEDAEYLFETASRFFSYDEQIFMGLGLATLNQLKFVVAIGYFKKSLEINPDNLTIQNLLSSAFLNYGVTLYQSKKTHIAQKQFKESIFYDSTQYRAYQNLAVCQYQNGQAAVAVKTVKTGLRHSPEQKDLLNMQVELAFEQKKFKESLRAAEELYEKQGPAVEEGLRLAYLYQFNNEAEKAFHLYQKLNQQFPCTDEIFNAYAEGYVNIYQFEKAVGVYRKILAQCPNKKGIRLKIADIYILDEEYKKSRNVMQEALKEKGNQIEFFQKIAESYIKEENIDSAVITYQQAIGYHPDNWGLYQDLGEICIDHNDSLAIVTFKAMNRLKPNHSYPFIQLGEVYEKIDSLSQAKTYFQKAIDIHTEEPSAYFYTGKWCFEDSLGDSCHLMLWEAVTKALKKAQSLEKKMVNQLQSSQTSFQIQHLESMNLSAQKIEKYYNLLRNCLDLLIQAEEPIVFIQRMEKKIIEHKQHAILLEYLGKCYENQGDYSNSLLVYQRAVKQDSQSKNSHLGMARIFEKQNKLELARIAYTRARIVDNRNRMIYESLIRISAQQGKLNELARKWYLEVKTESVNEILIEYLDLVFSQMEQTYIPSDIKPIYLDFRKGQSNGIY